MIKHGDCLELMKELPDNSIDMILCDLPYGITECHWDKIIDFEKLWEQYERIMTKQASAVLFAIGQFTAKLIVSNPKLFKYKWTWIKKYNTNFMHAKNRPMTKHEDILIFSKGSMGHKSLLKDKRMTYNPQGLIPCEKNVKTRKKKFDTYLGYRPTHKDEYTQSFTNYPCDVLYFEELSPNNKIHTSEKPIDLLEYLIKTYTNEGATVLDNCMGSGTTGVACMNTGRKFIGFEIDEKYYNIARERLNE